MTFEEWYGSLLPFERKCLTREEAFQAGAASRDADIARLKREDSRVKRAQKNSLKLANKVLSTKLAVEQAKNVGLLDFIARAQVSSGVCCCGEPMDGHSSPMSCGHSPVDMWDHAVRKLLDTPSDTSALEAWLGEPVAEVDDSGVVIVCRYDYKPKDKFYSPKGLK